MTKRSFTFIRVLPLFILVPVLFWACSKSSVEKVEAPTKSEATTLSADLNIALAGLVPCGTPKTVELTAGQTINSGTVTISNDSSNLYVTYNTIDGWKIKELHLWAGNCGTMPVNNGGNPAPGQFPYAWSSAAPYSQTQYTFTIPLDSIKMTDGCFCIAAHAAVVKTADDGTVTQEQTGWGHGENPFTGSRWGWTVNYCRQECPPPPPADTCYQTETGWGAGTRYVTKGNWATYTTYAAGGVKKIFAGQTNDAGTVSFSPVVNGMVTITIALANGWELQPGTESVKVQGYNTLPPASNPSPGLFNTYKGSELIINVPASTYYGVHLDLRKKIPCPVI